MTDVEMERHMEEVFTLVSAEPAQRALGVTLLNKPTVTTAKRPGRRGGVLRSALQELSLTLL